MAEQIATAESEKQNVESRLDNINDQLEEFGKLSVLEQTFRLLEKRSLEAEKAEAVYVKIKVMHRAPKS